MEAAALREMARGRWPAILSRLAPELEAALARIGRHGPCPVHGGKDGFRLFKDDSGGGICATCGAFPDGFALLRWLRGWNFPETLEKVAEALGVSEGNLPLAIPRAQVWQPRPPAPEQAAAIRQRLRQTWRDSVPLGHPRAEPVRKYLANRGLNPGAALAFLDLRCHPGLAYFEDGRRLGRFPALLAKVRDQDGQPVTIFRIYLTEDGKKAPVPKPKKLMPPLPGKEISGGAVRLGNPARLLGVAEGIETALAVHQVTGLTVWPVLSCTFLARFVPPEGVETLVVWADRDLSGAGEEAAGKLKDRVRIKTYIWAPGLLIPAGQNSLDWLDVLNTVGIMAFPIRKAGAAKPKAA